MKLAYIEYDVSVGRVVGSRVVGKGEIEAAAYVTREVLLPIFQEFRKGNNRVFLSVGNIRFVAWLSRDNPRLAIRATGLRNRRKFEEALKNALTEMDRVSRKFRSPAIFEQSGIYYVIMREHVVEALLGDDGDFVDLYGVEALLGLV